MAKKAMEDIWRYAELRIFGCLFEDLAVDVDTHDAFFDLEELSLVPV